MGEGGDNPGLFQLPETQKLTSSSRGAVSEANHKGSREGGLSLDSEVIGACGIGDQKDSLTQAHGTRVGMGGRGVGGFRGVEEARDGSLAPPSPQASPATSPSHEAPQEHSSPY